MIGRLGFIKKETKYKKSTYTCICCNKDITNVVKWIYPKFCPICGAEVTNSRKHQKYETREEIESIDKQLGECYNKPINYFENEAICILLRECGMVIEKPEYISNQIIFITVPKSSDIKTSDGIEVAGEYLAKVVRGCYLPEFWLRYTIRDEHWTKSMADEAKLDAIEELKQFHIKRGIV